jgi:hypothetical protein
MLPACLAVDHATCLATVLPACLAVDHATRLTILATRLAANHTTSCTTLHAQRNGVAGIQIHTGIHSSGPRGVGAITDRRRIERTRRLMVRRRCVYRKRQLVHSMDVCDFFL